MRVHLLVIDPQVDFMDQPGSALQVPGATKDMQRLTKLIARVGHNLDDVHVTLDSHQWIHVAHPGMWVNAKGEHPKPFTFILSSDIAAGIWRPRNGHVRPAALGGKTLEEFFLDYTREIESTGKYVLIIWPPHCIVGSAGYAIQPDLDAALQVWAEKQFANVDFVAKGITTFVEHYGALMAEVVLPSVPATGLNADLIQVLASADIIGVAGQALSHCVKSTVDQIAAHIGEQHIAKFHILVDASSPVPQTPGGPNFPQIADDWLHAMEKRGMTLTTTDKFLA